MYRLDKSGSILSKAKSTAAITRPPAKSLRDGLRLLEKEALLKQISVGFAAGTGSKTAESRRIPGRWKGVDGEQVFARLRQRSKSRRQNA